MKCTTISDRCCKLGRKAARHHLISPFYTCHYEALIAGLDHQTSVANRMRFAGRSKYTKTIVRTTAFRSRLTSCYLPRHKRCFESCCNVKKEALIKAAKHVQLKLKKPVKTSPKHVDSTPSIKHVQGIPSSKHVVTASTSKHVVTRPTVMHLPDKHNAKHVTSKSRVTNSNHVPATPSTKHVDLSNHIVKNITVSETSEI